MFANCCNDATIVALQQPFLANVKGLSQPEVIYCAATLPEESPKKPKACRPARGPRLARRDVAVLAALLDRYMGGFDHRPPLGDLGFLPIAERLRGQLILGRHLQP